MKRLTVSAAMLLAACGLFATPDFSAAHYAAIRENFAKKTEALEADRRAAVVQALERQLKLATQREVKARVSGNASAKADASQLVKMLTEKYLSEGKTSAWYHYMSRPEFV